MLQYIVRTFALVVTGAMLFVVGCKKDSPKDYYDSESGVNIPLGSANEAASNAKKDPGEYVLGWKEVIQLAEPMAKAERRTIYDWGLQRFSESPDFLAFYANLMDREGKDREGVETIFQAALKRDPDNMNVLAVYGLFLMRYGDIDKGESYLLRVDLSKVWSNTEMSIAIDFVQYANGEPQGRNAALHSLYGFLKAGQKSPRFHYLPCVARAMAKNHPEKAWLQKLADVCAGKAAFSSLDGWEAMKRAVKV